MDSDQGTSDGGSDAPFPSSARDLQGVIESVAAPIFVRDRRHRCVMVNDACCRLMGRPREEMLGQSEYDLLAREQAEIAWRQAEAVFTTGRDSNCEVACADAHGGTRTLSITKSLLRGARDGPFIVGIIDRTVVFSLL